MAIRKERSDRFIWEEGDVVFDKDFKTKEQLIKEGKLTPDGEVVKKGGFILASGSPRRRDLLLQAGLTDFVVRPTDAEEVLPDGLSPQETVEAVSRQKAEAARAAQDEIVVTADTMVFLDGLRLGKPRDEADALRMLTALQGRRHTVCTGVTARRGDRFLTRSESTDVTFRPASRETLLRYIATGEPMDKAGAYGLQGRGVLLIERVDGDFTNVIGLPLPLLDSMLSGFGLRLL